jgi:hypothetical protein
MTPPCDSAAAVDVVSTKPADIESAHREMVVQLRRTWQRTVEMLDRGIRDWKLSTIAAATVLRSLSDAAVKLIELERLVNCLDNDEASSETLLDILRKTKRVEPPDIHVPG